jgi:hypothetical protein
MLILPSFLYSKPIFFFILMFGIRQNIDADLGKVIAKVSGHPNPSVSIEIIDKKRERKKEKKTNQEAPSGQPDQTTQDTPIEVGEAEKPRDKKKKKKLKRTSSTSAATQPEASTFDNPIGHPDNKVHDQPQDPPQGNNSEPNNESSNSCVQPPPVKVFIYSSSYICSFRVYFRQLSLSPLISLGTHPNHL